VRHDDNVVLGDAHVELKHIDTETDRVFKRGQRILGPHGAAAAMGVDQNLCWGLGLGFHTDHAAGEKNESRENAMCPPHAAVRRNSHWQQSLHRSHFSQR
jgi:hypothetical protein